MNAWLTLYRKKIAGYVVGLLMIGSPLLAQSPRWEIDYLTRLANQRTPSQNSFYKNTSAVGSALALGLPTMQVALLYLQHPTPQSKQTALYLGTNLVLSNIYTTAIKRIVKRERPSQFYAGFNAIGTFSSNSFPSGHTSSIFSTITAFSLVYPKWYVIVPGYTLAGLTAYSRLYLGLHYPTDVIAGALIGTGAALAHYQLCQWMQKKKRIPKKY